MIGGNKKQVKAAPFFAEESSKSDVAPPFTGREGKFDLLSGKYSTIFTLEIFTWKYSTIFTRTLPLAPHPFLIPQ